MGALPGVLWWQIPVAQRPPTQTPGWRTPPPTPTGSPQSTRSARVPPQAPHQQLPSLSHHPLRRDSQQRRSPPRRSVSAGVFPPITAAPPSPGTRSRGQLTAVLLGLQSYRTLAALPPPTRTRD